MKYHSALHKPNNYPVVERVQLGNSVAFAHDLMLKIPDEYNKCDVIYTETAWIDGFEVFEERANIEQKRTFKEYITSLCKFIDVLNKPTVLITGKKTLQFLPNPESISKTVLNGATARVVTYGVSLKNVSTCAIILHELASKYDCIGDPCCGFGRSAKAFKQAGKDFVVSDYNKECIGYIAQEWNKW